MAQLVARLSGGQEVMGSSPVTPTTSKQGHWSCFLFTQKAMTFLPASPFRKKFFDTFCDFYFIFLFVFYVLNYGTWMRRKLSLDNLCVAPNSSHLLFVGEGRTGESPVTPTTSKHDKLCISPPKLVDLLLLHRFLLFAKSSSILFAIFIYKK